MSHFKCKTDSKYTLNKSESGKSLKSTNCRLLDFKPASVSFFSLQRFFRLGRIDGKGEK